MQYKFSVIIPVYNTGNYLEQCVNSVLNQSYTNFEIILVNDASTDNSSEICSHFATKDSRIIFKNSSLNQGQSVSRNIGLDIATGDYILFLDSDDWWQDENMLRCINEIIVNSNPQLIIFGRVKYNQTQDCYYDRLTPPQLNLDYTAKDEYETLLRKNVFLASACDKVIAKRLLDKLQLRFIVGQYCEDVEWSIKILSEFPKTSVISKDWYVYRQNPNSSSHNVKKKHVTDILSVISYYADRYPHDHIIQNYLGIQYVYLLATASKLKKEDLQKCLPEMKSLDYLLKYAKSKRITYIGRVMKWLGINNSIALLRLIR